MANGKQKVDEVLEINDDSIEDSSFKERLEAWLQEKMNAYSFTISRVPEALRRGKEEYYEPTIVSIGPYHRGKLKFEAMEAHKWGQLNDFLNRNPDISINTYLAKLRKIEADARRCYFENINLSSTEFVEMMMLDGCFILEMFLKRHYRDSNPTITYKSYFTHQVLIDLLLQENQIPFSVLQCLYNLNTSGKNNPSLMKVASECFSKYCKSHKKDHESNPNGCLNCNCKYDHLLHLFHCFHHPTNEKQLSEPQLTRPKLNLRLNFLKLVYLCFCCLRRKEKVEEQKLETVPCATKLVEAGITFKKGNSLGFFPIKFNNGTLEVPSISIYDSQRILMMNMIAFEQCNLPPSKRFLSFYASFMDNIIDTPKDVEILQQSRILESYLGSDEETANFFNQLTDHIDIVSGESYLLPVIDKINEYRQKSWNEWRAMLQRDYFSNPWSTISLMAALILLFLTFIQTFFAVFSYFKPRR